MRLLPIWLLQSGKLVATDRAVSLSREKRRGDTSGKEGYKYVPDQKDIYMYVAVASAQTKSYDEDLSMLETGLNYVEENDAGTKSFFYGQMGDVYHSAGDKEKSYEMYEKALSNNASNIPVLNNYSYFLAMEGRDLDKAERMSAQTVKAEPDNATYLDTYAWIFFKQGNYSLARIYFSIYFLFLIFFCNSSADSLPASRAFCQRFRRFIFRSERFFECIYSIAYGSG